MKDPSMMKIIRTLFIIINTMTKIDHQAHSTVITTLTIPTTIQLKTHTQDQEQVQSQMLANSVGVVCLVAM